MPLTELTSKHKWGPKILFPIKGETYWYPYDYTWHGSTTARTCTKRRV